MNEEVENEVGFNGSSSVMFHFTLAFCLPVSLYFEVVQNYVTDEETV